MNLKSLIHRELGEGLTEKELAIAADVSGEAIASILSGKLPHNPGIWEKLARYFRMEVDFLRTGESAHPSTTVELTRNDHHPPAGHLRMIPFLTWRRMEQMATTKEVPGNILADAMIETTDISGTRTFAVKVPDDSMSPLFGKEEMIFVNPDLKWKPGDYVLVRHPDGHPETLLRQIKPIESQYMLHPLNRKYKHLLLRNTDKVVGKVVRLTKNL